MKTKRYLKQICLLVVFPLALPVISITATPVQTNRTVIPFSQIGAAAREQYTGNGLSIVQSADGASLRCVFQKLEGGVNRKGLWLTSTDGTSNSPPFRVVAQSLGRENCMALSLADTGEVETHSGIARFHRTGLDEEYTVSVDGIRQDLIVTSRPAGNGALRVNLAVDGARATALPNGARLILDGSGRKLAYNRLKVTDAQGRDLTARMEVVSPTHVAVVLNDAEAVYPVRIDPTFSDANWISMGGLQGTDGVVDAAVIDGSGSLYIGGGFTVAGNVIANNIAKWDGTNWSALGSGIGGRVYALALSGSTLYAAGLFTNAGSIAANCIAAWNGSSWSALGSGMGGPFPDITALAVMDGTLYAGGSFTTAGGNANASFIAQWDGTNWSPVGSGIVVEGSGGVGIYTLAVMGSTLYVGGLFIAAGGIAADNIAQWDGTNWSSVGPGLSDAVLSLAASGNTLYAGGWFSYTADESADLNSLAQWDGTNWSMVGGGIGYPANPASVNALAVSGNILYVGGDFTTPGVVPANGLAQWNITTHTWSALGSVTNLDVTTFALLGGTLYVGGDFTEANGDPGNYIAQWNGSNWSSMGPTLALDGEVLALAVSGSTVYAGGEQGISQWDGSSWSSLGSAINGEVDALAMSGSSLYAGGSFTSVGGIAANNIAQWNPNTQTWSPLGSGLNGPVQALAVSGGTLYAGGEFTTAGGSQANYIAQWSGSTWSPLSSGMSSVVYALAVSGDTVYAGGLFTNAGGVPANGIAQWYVNTQNWSALGSGVQGDVSSLAVSGNTLYAGGFFPTAGGLPVNSIAQWSGGRWSALGSGMPWVPPGMGSSENFLPTVSALVVSGGTLYAGGQFTYASGVPVNCIACWNGSSWSPLESGMNNWVSALAVSGGTLYAGGDFTVAGTNASYYVAAALLTAPPASIYYTASPTNGLVPLVVQFTAQNVDSAGNSIVSWNWTFGDGNSSTNQNPLHTYTNAGSPYPYLSGDFFPSLVATNNLGDAVYGAGPPFINARLAVDYTIIVSASPSAGGRVIGGGTFASGSSQTVTATANSGYTFTNWTENGSVVSSSPNYTFTLSSSLDLVANFVMKGNPKLAITSPKSGQSVSNAFLLVTGTVTDNVALDAVYYQLNGGSWTLATPGNSWSNWTASVTLTPGTNTILAYAQDASGSLSPTNTVVFKYIASAMLVVLTNGNGTVTPNDNGKLLPIGMSFSLKAAAKGGFMFTNWTGGTNLPLAVLTNGAILRFMMQSNLVLQANFVDTNKPVLKITNVVAGLMVSNASFTVMGWATDNVAVASVYCQLNGTGWAGPTSFVGRNWSDSVTLNPGPNWFQAYAVDTSGNVSVTNTVSLIYREMAGTAQVQSLVASNTTFALNLYSQLATNSGNLFFSPYSISTCLAMLYAGASGNTEQQMSQVLGFATNQQQFASLFGQLQAELETDQEPNVIELNIANALWTQIGYPFLPAFLATATNQYQASVNQADFITEADAVTEKINNWVAQETQDKIQNTVPPGSINALTRLVLANAIYFKGIWAVSFAKTNTSTQPFYLSNTNQVNAPLMHQLAVQTNTYNYMETDDFQAIELPYGSNQVSMVILLPWQVDGYGQLEQQLSPAFLASVLAQMQEQEVEIFLPKFTLESSFELNDPLAEMGMPDAFTPGVADFSGIDGTTDLFISHVFHKAWVEVNEAGTQAAAATIVIGPSGSPAPPPIFRADHPFIFFILDTQSGSLLFLGRLADPS